MGSLCAVPPGGGTISEETEPLRKAERSCLAADVQAFLWTVEVFHGEHTMERITSATAESATQFPSPTQAELVKSKNEISDQIHELMERFKNRLTLQNLRFSERYVQSNLQIIVHIGERDGEEYVALFQGKALDSGGDESAPKIRGRSTRMACKIDPLGGGALARKQGVALEVRPDGQQQPVLIDVVETVQLVEGITLPSSVWFGSADSVYGILPHSLYFSRESGFVFSGVLEDWEIHMGERTRSVRPHVHQQVGQVIKSAPKIMNRIADDKGEVEGKILSNGEIVAALSGLRIVLEPSRICAFFMDECGERRIQIKDVLFGPFDF